MGLRKTVEEVTIDNISILEYFSLEDATKYDIFLDHMNPKNLFCGKECNTSSLSFDEVQVTKAIFNNPNTEDLKDLYLMLFNIKGSRNDSPDKLFFNESIFNLFAATNYIKKWLDGINKKEAEWLSGTKNDVLEMLDAGKRLAPFNHLLRKIELAKMFGVTPSDIGKWKYSKVFSILAATQVKSEIQKEYNEIN